MVDEKKSFWTSLPGILTGLGAVITAITGFYLAIGGHQSSPLSNQPTSIAPPQTSTITPQKGISSEGDSQHKKPILAHDQIFSKKAVIDDPDGFSYVRSMKSTSGQIIAKVYNNEVFYTYVQDGNWWQVKTESGKIGYMHVSRIRLK